MTLIAVGKIVNVHGIKGVVKIKPYLTHGKDLPQFNPLTDKTGKKSFEVSISGTQGECLLANLKGITTREVAEQFKGLELYADRSKLPATENNEFYCCDLVGMKVMKDGSEFGKVVSVMNFGAGDILEIKTMKGKQLDFAFSKKTFPRVDTEKKELEIVIPEGMEGVAK